jgi:hypothetical protein
MTEINHHQKITSSMEKKKSVTTPMGFCHNDAPSHKVVLIKQLLSKKEIPVLEHSMYHLTASSMTSLFPETKMSLKIP